MTPALETRDLCKSFGPCAVLSGLALSVPQGALFAIIGPNGSGKTTLLKTLSGLVPPTSGTVLVHGRPLARFSRRELARRMALVPQTFPEQFPFTAAETVRMGRAPHQGVLGIPDKADEAAVDAALDACGVSALRDRTLDRLSGGERQRVFIARALCQDPRILLLDEPTASLDPAHQIRVMDLLDRLRAEHGVTVVIVSHDLNLAAMYADVVLVLKNGRAAAVGPPEEVLTPERLRAVYEARFKVVPDDAGKGVRILPLRNR